MKAIYFILYIIICIQESSLAQRPVLTEIIYKSSVSSRFAETELTATFINPRRRSTRKNISLVLPKSCLLSTISIQSPERNITGFVRPRISKKRGRNSKRPDIQLLNRESNSQQLKMKIILKPHERATVKLKYMELLQRKRGLYYLVYFRPKKSSVKARVTIELRDVFPLRNISFLYAKGDLMKLHVLPNGRVTSQFGDSMSLYMDYQSGGTFEPFLNRRYPSSLSESTYELNDHVDLLVKDPAYIFAYDIDRQPDGGELQVQDGYFAHFLAPEGLPKLPLHTVFVLDISGSMVKLKKMRSLQAAMDDILHSLSLDDSFEIVLFSTSVVSLGAHRATPDKVSENVKKINLLRPYGGTNINDALLEALHGAKKFKQKLGAKQIVFLTDGIPTVGETNPDSIRRNVRSANDERLPIYSLAFGNDADLRFLRKVSHENSAFSRKIDSNEESVEQLKKFYEEISVPLLTDLEVSYNGRQVNLPTTVRSGGDQFYSGNEIVMTGKLEDDISIVEPTIIANSALGRTQLRVSRKKVVPPSHSTTGELERLWAYLSIKDLLEGLEHIEDRSIRNEMKSRALKIAIEYNYVTPFTPLSLIESPSSRKKTEFLDGPKEGRTSSKEFPLLSFQDFMGTFPKGSMGPSQSRRYSFGADYDPHFVVHLPSIPLPVCFDLHGKHGQIFELVKDELAGVIINGEVNTTPDRPKATHFTRISLHILYFNMTVTTDGLYISCSNETHRIEARVIDTCGGTTRERKRSYCDSQEDYGNIIEEQMAVNKGCETVFKWFNGLQIRHGEIALMITGNRKRKKLSVTVGDVALHAVITNTRMKNGNSFLGIYIQNHKMLSPSTSGVIGQFLYKSVGIIGHFPKLLTHPASQENRLIPLAVVHTLSSPSVTRVTEVLSVVSRRNSLLQRGKILCLHVKRQGEGLLDRKPDEYVTKCLYC